MNEKERVTLAEAIGRELTEEEHFMVLLWVLLDTARE